MYSGYFLTGIEAGMMNKEAKDNLLARILTWAPPIPGTLKEETGRRARLSLGRYLDSKAMQKRIVNESERMRGLGSGNIQGLLNFEKGRLGEIAGVRADQIDKLIQRVGKRQDINKSVSGGGAIAAALGRLNNPILQTALLPVNAAIGSVQGVSGGLRSILGRAVIDPAAVAGRAASKGGSKLSLQEGLLVDALKAEGRKIRNIEKAKTVGALGAGGAGLIGLGALLGGGSE